MASGFASRETVSKVLMKVSEFIVKILNVFLAKVKLGDRKKVLIASNLG
jgi:hypothetical protein